MTIDAIVQSGALGLLVLVLFYGGKIAKTFVEQSLKTFEKLTDNIGSMTKEISKVTEEQEATAKAIESMRRENNEDHVQLSEALRRLGGFRPSPAQGTPVVREKVLSRPGER